MGYAGLIGISMGTSKKKISVTFQPEVYFFNIKVSLSRPKSMTLKIKNQISKKKLSEKFIIPPKRNKKL